MDNERSAGDLLTSLREAIDTRDWPEVNRLADVLAARVNEFELAHLKAALERLRRARRFAPLQKLAGAMIEAGTVDTSVRLRHVQALLGQGEVTGSRAILEDILNRERPGGRDRCEMLGLIGQSFKQASLATPVALRSGHLLVRAIENYNNASNEAAKASDDHAWLKYRVNVIALIARAGRRKYPLDGVRADAYTTLAQRVRERVGQADAAGAAVASDFAAALEACVALGEFDAAACWARRLGDVAANDAFEISTLVQQLVDVWDLAENSTAGRLVLPVLKAALLQSEGGQVALTGASVASTVKTIGEAEYEKVFGDERYVPFTWYLAGVERCRTIARFESPFGRGMGSGVLVRGSQLHPGLGDRWLAMTNAHVLSPDDWVRSALRLGDAKVSFQGHVGDDRGPFPVTEILWSSPPQELDATLAVVKQVPSVVAEYAISERPLNLLQPSRIYAIGHPLGGDLSLSIHDNLLVDFLEPRIHYRTPTEPGSSGSPLFDDAWNLIGLHHAGSSSLRKLRGDGCYQANEGIWMHSIIVALRESLGL
jgi:hypothetical protein